MKRCWHYPTKKGYDLNNNLAGCSPIQPKNPRSRNISGWDCATKSKRCTLSDGLKDDYLNIFDER